MKKGFLSFALIAFGAGLWLALSAIAHYSMNKWDGKFVSVLRQNLSQAGLSNEDVMFSVSEVHGPSDEPWVTQTVEVKKMDAEKAASLKKALENAGAHVEETTNEGKHVMLVSRGNRLYQKVTYTLSK